MSQSQSEPLQRVALVDDDQSVRAGYHWTVEDAGLIAVDEAGPLGTIEEASRIIQSDSDAALCDHQLQVHDYAYFSGAELTASLNTQQFPAILCTRWEEAHIDYIRPYRRWIPVLMRPEELNPESLVQSISVCRQEFESGPADFRRPWRTQIHVAEIDVDNDLFYVELPSWSRDLVIRLRGDILPDSLRSSIEPGMRLHAQVNAAAETAEDLYFIDWEEE
jgi:hypothetical protein